MKVRNSFVSNSSSTSFVIRGIEIKTQKVLDQLSMEFKCKYCDPQADDCDCVAHKIDSKLKGLNCKSTVDFFDGEQTGTVIIGSKLCDLNDGVVEKLPNPNDEKIKEKISEALNMNEVKKLHTFVQFVSNDNY